jgi:hypothetical protein
MEISKRNLAISLVLFGENFINNFFKYTLKTILNEKNFLNRKIKFFLISTEKKNVVYLIKKKIK